MNAIRQTQLLNKRELENAIPPSASWHADYRDTAYIYIGGIPLDVSEGDVVTIFSQYGSPTHINMIRDKETGKSKGFAFLKYEDQRSCDLAVDNFGGAEVLGLGLANRLVEPAAVVDEALSIATVWAAAHPAAMGATKSLFHRVADLPYEAAMAAGRDVNALMRGFRDTP